MAVTGDGWRRVTTGPDLLQSTFWGRLGDGDGWRRVTTGPDLLQSTFWGRLGDGCASGERKVARVRVRREYC
ncbi:hypothetical protein TIFTF001_038849 [Ficus carica]|uniref:Uncharacterized protein n=1 Tax=Ficus carica TaxID=3494 RepID=A0AA88JEC7_FICCA|nr:hypothetical protein TIFTF001_038849 [Ficus carica]